MFHFKSRVMEVKIKQGNEMLDATIEMVDGVMVVSPKKVKFEPKDGDVVYSGGFYDFVFIYKENLTAEAYYYVSLFLKDNKIELPDGGHIGYVSQLRLATEEEKKKLFDKIAEEGYEWKADTKEIVKLKWKPGLGERYYYPDLSEFNSSPDSFTWANDETDEGIYARGWCFKTEEECQEFCNRLNDVINSVKP